MKKILLVVAFILSTREANAQTINVPSLPATINVTWDDTNPLTVNVTGYSVALDTQTPIIVPSTKPTPCIDCGSINVTVTTAGNHTFTLITRTATVNSSPLVLTRTIVVASVTPPAFPINVRIAISANNTVPPLQSVTDSTGAVWTVTANTVPCTVPSTDPNNCHGLMRKSPNEQIYVQVGIGRTIFYTDNIIYALGQELSWWKWVSNSWVLFGPNPPS